MLGSDESVIVADSPRPPLVDFQNHITAFIEIHAAKFFVVLALLYLVTFNGQWRIGLDSANYRGLADSLANGRGYTFGAWAPHSIYPGLPVVLALLQRLSGNTHSAVLPCIFMLIASALTLRVTYLLIRLHFPKWMAVTVTFGLGTNAWFLQQSSELMTDVPFALGVVGALYGWDRLRLALRNRQKLLIPTLQLLAGLALAASMRPTFLILVGAGGIACGIGLLVGPQRKFYAIALTAILAVWAIFVALDPRSAGFHPISGGYEREAAELITTGSTRVQQVLYVLNDQFPAGVFGEQLAVGSIHVNGKKYSPTSILGSLLVIAAPLLLLRRHMLWALLVWLTVIATILYAAEPRYYLMVMPILLLGWLMLWIMLARKLPPIWSDVVLATGLGLMTLNNMSASIGFVREQRSSSFLANYHKGKWLGAVRMATLIKAKVLPGESVIGPSGSVISFLSGRHVYSQRELFPPHAKVEQFPRILAEKKIKYAVFPAPFYRDKEPAMSRLMERGILRPVRRIGEAAGMRLSTMRVFVPPGNWEKQKKIYGKAAQVPKPKTKLKKKKKKPATRPMTRPTTKPTTKRAAGTPSTTTRATK